MNQIVKFSHLPSQISLLFSNPSSLHHLQYLRSQYSFFVLPFSTSTSRPVIWPYKSFYSYRTFLDQIITSKLASAASSPTCFVWTQPIHTSRVDLNPSLSRLIRLFKVTVLNCPFQANKVTLRFRNFRLVKVSFPISEPFLQFPRLFNSKFYGNLLIRHRWMGSVFTKRLNVCTMKMNQHVCEKREAPNMV